MRKSTPAELRPYAVGTELTATEKEVLKKAADEVNVSNAAFIRRVLCEALGLPAPTY